MERRQRDRLRCAPISDVNLKCRQVRSSLMPKRPTTSATIIFRATTRTTTGCVNGSISAKARINRSSSLLQSTMPLSELSAHFESTARASVADRRAQRRGMPIAVKKSPLDGNEVAVLAQCPDHRHAECGCRSAHKWFSEAAAQQSPHGPVRLSFKIHSRRCTISVSNGSAPSKSRPSAVTRT